MLRPRLVLFCRGESDLTRNSVALVLVTTANFRIDEQFLNKNNSWRTTVIVAQQCGRQQCQPRCSSCRHGRACAHCNIRSACVLSTTEGDETCIRPRRRATRSRGAPAPASRPSHGEELTTFASIPRFKSARQRQPPRIPSRAPAAG